MHPSTSNNNARARRTFALGVCLGLLAMTSTVHAAAVPAEKEEVKTISYGKKAFQDGLYDAARLKFEEFLKNYPKSEQTTEVRLLLAQSNYFLGELRKAQDLLAIDVATLPEALKPEYVFWQAEISFALKNWAEAATRYQSLLNDYPNHALALKARLGLSSAILQTDGMDAALAPLEPLLKSDNKDKSALQAGQLQKVRLLITGGKLEEASLLVDQLAKSKLDRTTQLQVWYWTAELARQADKSAKSLEYYQKITSDSHAFPRELLAKAWYGTGLVLRGSQKWLEASNAFEEAYKISRDPALIQSAVNSYLGAQVKNDSLTQGTLKIRQLARDRGTAGLSGFYAIAQYYYDAENYDAAIAELDNLVNNNPDSFWKWPARLIIAEALYKKHDAPSAMQNFNDISQQCTDPVLALNAKMRLAEIQSENNDAQAAANFLDVARKTPSAELSENGYYRALLTLGKTGNLDEFATVRTEFEAKFPKSNRLNDVLMEQARLLEASGKSTEARAIYQNLAKNKTDANKSAEAMLNLAQSQTHSGDNAGALQTLQDLEKNNPDFPQIAQVVYRRIILQNQSGILNSEGLRTELTHFVEHYPKEDDLVAYALFRVGESYYNQGDYGLAQAKFQAVADQYPKHSLADQALYWNSRCNMALGNYKEAVAILEKISANSPFKANARLAQIRCFIHQNNFPDALRIADSVLTNRPEDEVWAEASLRKINCLYTLASNDPKLYGPALDVANKLLSSKAPNVAQRNEAGCLKGEILEKLLKPGEALSAYLDVVYGRVLPQDISGQPDQPEHYWFIRSGVLAAQMRVTQGDVKGAVEIYRILERLGEPTREEFRKKIEDLKSRNFLYEES